MQKQGNYASFMPSIGEIVRSPDIKKVVDVLEAVQKKITGKDWTGQSSISRSLEE